MKTRKALLALVILLLLVFMQGQAKAARVAFITGDRLVKMMFEHDKYMVSDKSASHDEVGRYQGYISGVVDGILWQGPSGITIDQIGSVVSKYLKNHPERWHKAASDLVIEALKEAFPLEK